MGDQLMFVQFPHPGGEHRPVEERMPWNRGNHLRKFLRADGDYVLDGNRHAGRLVFWGEWEPPSRIIARFPDGGLGEPRCLHEPVLEVPSDGGWRQNTDPLVFGDTFLYTNCRQPRNHKLRELAPGSLILFGSKLGPRAHPDFVLDTVFVVEDGVEYVIEASAALDCCRWVQDVVFEPLRLGGDEPGRPYRMYRSRVYAGEASVPFSFVPCLPAGASPMRFARPVIRLDRRWLNPQRTMGAGAVPATTDELAEIWRDVVRQVTAAGLALGTRLEVPQRRSASNDAAPSDPLKRPRQCG